MGQTSHQGEAHKSRVRTMSRNMLYLVIGGLAVVTMILGYQFYLERQKTSGVEISIGDRGISIEKK
ncbi:RsiW-degrading membrane proteinase PrsW (M82 family) [Bradyrhizobium liaoningense]|uniref:hypothetical protein n=1 Tax=Bradyrhizobium sp. USDA 241 TaxID=3377725 RepID=UPI003C72ECCA